MNVALASLKLTLQTEQDSLELMTILLPLPLSARIRSTNHQKQQKLCKQN